MNAEELTQRSTAQGLTAEEIKGDLHITVAAEDIKMLCTLLKSDANALFNYPGDLTGRDTGEELLLWYRLYSMKNNQTALITVRLPREAPEIDSVIGIWPGFDYHERECFDMYGIRFNGHPDVDNPEKMRILLPEDWVGHPFRKDYEPVFSGNPLHGPQETN